MKIELYEEMWRKILANDPGMRPANDLKRAVVHKQSGRGGASGNAHGLLSLPQNTPPT